MINDTQSEGSAFLADVADKLEAAASTLDSGAAAPNTFGETKSSGYLNANFASKLVYTSCYMLSYGVCFPVFVACHYVPKNNRFVEGLVDGRASANQSVDDMLERVKANRLVRKQSAEHKMDFDDIVEAGAGALGPA